MLALIHRTGLSRVTAGIASLAIRITGSAELGRKITVALMAGVA